MTRAPAVDRLWSIGRGIALFLVPVLLGLLLLEPHPTLEVLWFGIIPILPATFFLSPALWRGICPLATLNQWGNRLGADRGRRPSVRAAAVLSLGGLFLFHLMVPARRFLFNLDEASLVATVGAGAVGTSAGVA